MKKDSSIQIIRLISFIMIICCHILQGLENKWAFWVNIGVQIFFFMSGFLYGNKEIRNVTDFYKKRIKKILLPLSLLVIIMIIIEKVLLGVTYSKSFIISNVLGCGVFNGILNNLSHTWFVSYIMICYLITPILQYIFKNISFRRNIKIFLVISIFLQLAQIFKIVNINIPWIINYILGYFYSKCCKTKKHRKVFGLGILVSMIVILPFAIIYQENINIVLPDILNYYRYYIMNYGHVLLGSFIFICLYKWFSILKIPNNRFLNFIDKFSYCIYLVHQIFILNTFSLLKKTNNIHINIILIIISSVFFGIVLYYINIGLTKILDIINKKKIKV